MSRHGPQAGHMTRPGANNRRASVAGTRARNRASPVLRHGLLCRDRVLWPCVATGLGPGRELLCRDRELSIATGLGHGRRSSCRNLMLWVATEFGHGHGNRVATWRTSWHDEARVCGAKDPPPKSSA